jgi:tRNA pseudouridine55 synthase
VIEGVINLDKPAGQSSARMVGIIKRQLLPRGTKVGHAGTLDPFATGVLLILVGRATKRCEELMHGQKEYLARLRFGATTPTLDPESAETVDAQVRPVDEPALRQAMAALVGEIEQMPPVYSALKIGGRPAYELARKGKPVELKARRVRIDALELLRFNWPEAEIRVACGRGTYIRSLARDVAAALGTLGYVRELRRTQVGPFRIEQSVTLEKLLAEGVAAHLA